MSPIESAGREVTADFSGAEFDFARAVRLIQSVSTELARERLAKRIVVLALEQSAAERALLVLVRNGELQIEAEGRAVAGELTLELAPAAVSPSNAPESVLSHVTRARKSVSVGDTCVDSGPFGADPYLKLTALRAFSCIPLLLQGRVTGLLYLESAREPYVFTSRRIGLLELLASQAAISLENARRYAELKNARDELESALRDSRTMIDAMPALTWSTGPDGAVELLNQSWLNYTGMSREQAAGWGWSAAFHPDDVPEIQRAWEQFRASGSANEIELRLRRYDGVYRWFLIRVRPLHDQNGQIVRWYGSNMDIDDLKRTQEQLRRSEGLLAHGERVSATGAFSWRIADDDIHWTDELYRIFEFQPSTRLTLETISRRVHPDDLSTLAEFVARAHAGAGELDYTHRLIMPDASIKHLRLLAHATRNSNGELEYIGAVHDVTAHRRSEEALAKVGSDLASMTRVAGLAALTAAIAHEVNQPLAGIMTNTATCQRMLTAEPPNVNGALEILRRTLRDSRRAGDVILRIRTLFGKKTGARELVNLNDATREVLALVQNELQRNGVVLHSELAEGLPELVGDRIQIQQVILNLLLNASEAMTAIVDRRRQLVIRTEPEGTGRVRLTVTDVGEGLQHEDLDQLFDALYTTKSGGVAIGLSVSRSIIERHGGRLWATPNGDGPGSSFSFSLPGGVAETSAARSERAANRSIS